jgi:hypothetical protein
MTEQQSETLAEGNFKVVMSPLEGTAGIRRMQLAKEFTGALNATSEGEMLGAMGAADGSAGYVAIERVTGTLDGRNGSFVLQHNGILDRGTPSLTVTVVPDTGTGELTGLSGTMEIEAEQDTHIYRFTYTLTKR